MSTSHRPPYYRRDQAAGITAPDLTKDCSPAEHIVRARGRRTNLTSVSTKTACIEDFGETTYVLDQEMLSRNKHGLIQHHQLTNLLRQQGQTSEKADRARAIQALRYATRRSEGLIQWTGFDISGIARQNVISWAFSQVQAYFGKA